MTVRSVVICADRVGARMAGPAIRSYEIARALGPGTVLAGLPGEGEAPSDVRFHPYDLRDVRSLAPVLAGAELVFAQPQWPHLNRAIVRSGARLVVDLYDPEPLEGLEGLAPHAPWTRRLVETVVLDRVLEGCRSAHHLVCATERQRDLWLGLLLGAGLVSAAAYGRDPTFRDMIDLLPFGVPSVPPQPGPGARAALGLGPDAEVVLWNGGLWPWLDAPTAIRGIAALAQRRPQVRLVFMGTSGEGPGRAAAERAREVARGLGVLGTVVHVNEGWVGYRERGGWLLDADCALSTHVDHLETRFAFRTRLLDCLWARVPIVCTQGDELGALVEARDLGATVGEGDADAVAAAVERVLDRGRDAYAPRLEAAAEAYAWDRVVAPVRRWAARATHPPRLGDGVPHPVGPRVRSAAAAAGVTAAARLGLSPYRLAGIRD